MFIAAMIKEQCPNVQIMLVTSDILHLHPEYSRIMHGALVASSYPMYPESLTWCFPYGEHYEPEGSVTAPGRDHGHSHGDAEGGQKPHAHFHSSRNIVLGNHGMYGIYNALVFLRGMQAGKYQLPDTGDSVLLDRCRPETPLPLSYGPPFCDPAGKPCVFRPAVWVSRIGSSNFHPITAERTDGPTESVELASARNYTLKLEIADAKSLPRRHVHTRVPLSLYLVTLFWIIAAAAHCILILAPRMIGLGKWSDRLQVSEIKSRKLSSLFRVFRSLNTVCFTVMLGLLGFLGCASRLGLDLSEPWSAELIANRVLIGLSYLCGGMIIALMIALLIDLGRAILDAFWATDDFDLWKRLMAVRLVVAIFGLAVLVACVGLALWQVIHWKDDWRLNAYLWFSTAGDLWNGLSFLVTVQLPFIAVILLVYGMLVQLNFLRDADELKLPVQLTARNDPTTLQLRDAMLFPVLSRINNGSTVVLSLLALTVVLAWLFYLWSGTQGPDFFGMKFNLTCILWLLAMFFWFVRFFKLVHILRSFLERLKFFRDRLQGRWPKWGEMFKSAEVQKNSLEDLLWCSDPRHVPIVRSPGRRPSLQDECAEEIDRFVRVNFYLIGRLTIGLIVAGCLLFLAAQSFPLSSEPLLRTTASAMLAATGGLIVWYYVRFDCNEVLSHLVGTDPNKVAWNWSMIQNVAPGVLLAVIAFVNQVFPDAWYWLQNIAEPLARLSS